ncbi:hypothetical protein AYI68_g3486 [Smittium mucronatum]|uniref:Uncharacterized protein n=1 Tax=Smittium mucronatum TaxID=133383 RepID=A0A1R0GZV7_9FUNG|nr:hypothetical protein AYI68_g3486 [Smittium mucronatum]
MNNNYYRPPRPDGYNDGNRPPSNFSPNSNQYGQPQQRPNRDNHLVGEGPLKFDMPGAESYGQNSSYSDYGHQAPVSGKFNFPNQNEYGDYRQNSNQMPSAPISEPGFGFAFAGRPTADTIGGNRPPQSQYNMFPDPNRLPPSGPGFAPPRPAMNSRPSYGSPGGFNSYDSRPGNSGAAPGPPYGGYDNFQSRPSNADFRPNDRPMFRPNPQANFGPDISSYNANPQRPPSLGNRPGYPSSHEGSSFMGNPGNSPRPGNAPNAPRPPSGNGMEWVQLKNK